MRLKSKSSNYSVHSRNPKAAVNTLVGHKPARDQVTLPPKGIYTISCLPNLTLQLKMSSWPTG